MPLTPEEEKELLELESELGSEDLTPEEEAELAELEAAEIPEGSVKETIGGVEFNVVEGDKPSMSDRAGAFAVGALNSLSLNMVDEVGAVAATAQDIINNPPNSIAEVSAIYDKHQTDIENTIGAIEKDFPAETISGGIAGGVASAGLAPYKAALGSLKGAVGLGAAAGFGEAQVRKGEIAPIAAGAALGGIGGAAGKFLSKPKVPKKVVSKHEELIELRGLALKDAFGITGKTNKFVDLLHSKNNMKPEVFYKDVLDNVDIAGVKDPVILKERVGDSLKRIWETKLKASLESIDDVIPEGSVNLNKLKESVILEIQDSGSNLSEPLIAKKLANVFPEKDVITMLESQSVLNKLDKITGLTKNSKSIVDQAIRSEMLDAAEAAGGGLSKEFLAAKRMYGNVADTKKFMGPVIDKYAKDLSVWGQNKSSLASRVSNTFDKLSIIAPGKSAVAVGKLLSGYNPRPEFEPIGRLVSLSTKADNTAESIKRIGDAIIAKPGKYGAMAQRLGAAAGVSATDFMQKLGLLDSHISLDAAPIQRSSESIHENSVHLLNIAKDLNPGVHAALKKAFEGGDQNTINKIVSSASSMPEFKGKIIEGIGIDGQLYTELDKSKAKSMVKNANVSNSQKMVHLESINNGIVPQLQPEVPFKDFKMLRERDKKSGKKEVKI